MNLKQFLILFGMLVFGACTSETKSEQAATSATTTAVENVIYERMNVPDFQTKLAATSSPQLIDVRTPEEFSQGNIPGAVNINIQSADFIQNISKMDKSKPVFAYCQAGGRSKKCAEKMKDMGFEEIYELAPGYSGWEQ